tara:strand:+ start:6607 stop:7161 length:555 start_codon:yes stop_codon:yes gene_type:complete
MGLLTIAGIIIVAVIVWTIFVYNNFIRLMNRVDEAWADISVQLKRRYDLIPNLIETVKGYAAHEKETFAEVTEMRTRAMSAEGMEAQGEAENMLTGALKSLFAVSENYPDLKANENFVELQRELTDTENKIQASRRFYNTNVRDLNTSVESFPNNIMANMFKFGKRDFFELDEEEAREPINVQF